MNEFDSIGPSWALLCAALALAVAAPASRAAVSQTQETTQSAPASSAADAALRGRVIRLLSEDPDTRLLALSVEVREGIAYLRGGAPNLKVRNDALLVAGRFKEGDERLAEALIERVNRVLRSVRVSATVENGVGTLVGRVRTPSERARARNAALEMEGLQGLDNQLLALSDADLDDTRMRVRLIELIENRRQYPMEGDILVEVENGVVSLSGQVPRVYDRLIAERVVDIVSGVRGLRNEIEVVPAAGGHVTRTVPVQP
jgi:osmotically-inducible protein OsmY